MSHSAAATTPGRRIVVVCQVFHPDTQSTSQLFSDLFAGLAGPQTAITVLSGFPGQIDPDATDASRAIKREDRHGSVRVRRCGLRIASKKSLVARAAAYLSYIPSCTWNLWKLRRADFVLGATNPPITPVWLWICAKLFRLRYQLILLDIYPDGLVALGLWRERNPGVRIWRWANRRAFARAEKLLVLGRDMRDHVCRLYRIRESCVHYMPNWSSHASEQSPNPEETRLWKRLGFTDVFVVQYSGNMGLWHDIDMLVRAACRLRHNPHIRFVFIGDGLRKVQAQRLANDLGGQNITWLPFQPKPELSDSLACCHLSVISQREGIQGIAVPCKLYGILASGRGVIAAVPAGSEIQMVVDEEACGVVVSPGDDEGLADLIRRLSCDRSRVREMGRLAHAAYMRKYTLAAAVRSYEQLWKLPPRSEPVSVDTTRQP